MICIRTTVELDATKSFNDEEDDKTRWVDLRKYFIQEIQILTDCCSNEKMKMCPEFLIKERSKRAITHRVVVPSISSSSSFQLNEEEFAGSASPLAWVPGLIPDFRDFMDIDIQSWLDFSADKTA